MYGCPFPAATARLFERFKAHGGLHDSVWRVRRCGSPGLCTLRGTIRTGARSDGDTTYRRGKVFFNSEAENDGADFLPCRQRHFQHPGGSARYDKRCDRELRHAGVLRSDAGNSPGPFTLPATGPAYVKASDKRSSLFYLRGKQHKSGPGLLRQPSRSEFCPASISPDIPPTSFPGTRSPCRRGRHQRQCRLLGAATRLPHSRTSQPGFGPFTDLNSKQSTRTRSDLSWTTRRGWRCERSTVFLVRIS